MSQRLLTHDCLTLSRAELQYQWCLDEMLEQHDVLDEIDNQRRLAQMRSANG